jgi:hypothetical protein
MGSTGFSNSLPSCNIHRCPCLERTFCFCFEVELFNQTARSCFHFWLAYFLRLFENVKPHVGDVPKWQLPISIYFSKIPTLDVYLHIKGEDSLLLFHPVSGSITDIA